MTQPTGISEEQQRYKFIKNKVPRSRQRSEGYHTSEMAMESKKRRPNSDAIYKRAVLPKTANHIYNMQKGLYMKTLQTPHVINRNMTNKSLNMLNAYGELPSTGDIHSACDSVKFYPQLQTNERRRVVKKTSYMQVINDSNASVLRKERDRILNMSFDNKADKREWTQLHSF